MELKDLRILITGGSSGIGAAIAELAHDHGARVVINGRDEARLEDAAQRLHVMTSAGNVGDAADAKRIVEETTEKLGGLDVLINNAAWGHGMTIEDFDPEAFEAMWRTNVLGVGLMTHYALPALQESSFASVVNIASTAGLRGYARGGAYASTKFALRGLTECMRAELRPHDIRVMLINPSEVQTAFGGKDPNREMNPYKLHSDDIAHAVIAALEMHPRGFIPEMTVFATNPWKE